MTRAEPKILFYDIETTLLGAYTFRTGEQYIRHDQLIPGLDKWDIICIGYAWNDGQPAKSMDWGLKKQDSAKMLREFDKIIREADVVIGKNSDRFDNKHLNTHRMLNDEDGMPEWVRHTDDLEKHIRKNFALPSYGLDYLSKILNLGGKNPMGMQDWVEIQINKNPDTLEKMLTYCRKDVEDTRAIWNKISKHFTPKFNRNAFHGDFCCVHCGSTNIRQNGTRQSGKSLYQNFFCNEHGGYAGKRLITIGKDKVTTTEKLGV